MTKFLRLFALAATVIFAGALVSSTSFGEESKVTKRGEIRFTKIEAEKDGVVKTYSVDASVNTFMIWTDGKNLSAGSATKCDPYLGATTKDLAIDANVEEVVIKGWDSNYKDIVEVVKAKAPASLLVKKGTSLFGRCGGKTDSLVAVSLQSQDMIEVKY